ncbi:MAG: hypothetical protein GY904_25695 [Planctomycetaceae bacterium]|nr:hypothetical protein [Planctomycetaceae bacterium]
MLLFCTCAVRANERPTATTFHQSTVQPFFKSHCIGCHGPEKTKGEITLHTLDDGGSTGRDVERWERVGAMLESGDMPPEVEPQPSQSERMAIGRWIETGLRDTVTRASQTPTVPTTRRLTKFEFQNTMRDLLISDSHSSSRSLSACNFSPRDAARFFSSAMSSFRSWA